ncbi:MAG: transcription-repair coupling factor, partial [Acidobacteria bacterium]|nr:transcription-repair coupling factor [Acidobacteriota bacterium]
MVLSFVRELLADVEHTPSFQRAAAILKGASVDPPGGKAGAGRLRLSGLTATAKALHLALLHRSTGKPLLILAADNRAAEDLTRQVQAFCELAGVASPDSVMCLPSVDVLPYENLSPHAEIQEKRASGLVRVANGTARIVITPAVAAAMRLRQPDFYAALERTVRKGDALDVDDMVRHLNAAGYTRTDVVEMAGEYAVRGGILDVYSPEQDFPVRLEVFGDEVESIRRFDTGTQRSLAAVDDVELLPLTETPVDEAVLAGIHARLSGLRVAGPEEIIERAITEAGVTAFPGWELYAPLAFQGEPRVLFDLLPQALVAVDEPALCTRELNDWWERLEQAHERSGVGSLARPGELFFHPELLKARLAGLPGLDLEQLPLAASVGESIHFASQTTPRFHNSVPAIVEEVRRITQEGGRALVCAGNTGEVERLADIFTEYGVIFRLGTRAARPGDSYMEETSYLSGDLAGATIAKACIPNGVALPGSGLVIFGSCDLFDESEPVAVAGSRSKSRAAAFMSDFRDLQAGDFVVHVEHGIGRYSGLKEIPQGDSI